MKSNGHGENSDCFQLPLVERPFVHSQLPSSYALENALTIKSIKDMTKKLRITRENVSNCVELISSCNWNCFFSTELSKF